VDGRDLRLHVYAQFVQGGQQRLSNFWNCSIDSYTSKILMIPPASIAQWKIRPAPCQSLCQLQLPERFVAEVRGEPG
jgi:hypothetical protein